MPDYSQPSLIDDGHEDCPYCGNHNLDVLTFWQGKFRAVKCRTCKATGPAAPTEEEAWRLFDHRVK